MDKAASTRCQLIRSLNEMRMLTHDLVTRQAVISWPLRGPQLHDFPDVVETTVNQPDTASTVGRCSELTSE